MDENARLEYELEREKEIQKNVCILNSKYDKDAAEYYKKTI